jgi:hypothetical protein
MTPPATPPTPQTHIIGLGYLVTTLLVFAVAAPGCATILQPYCGVRDVFILAIIVIVWSIDVAIKWAVRISNETGFADLSFTSLMFIIGRWLPSITGGTTNSSFLPSEPVIAERNMLITIILGILAILWIINVVLSRRIGQRVYWTLSLALSVVSTAITVILHRWGWV